MSLDDVLGGMSHEAQNHLGIEVRGDITKPRSVAQPASLSLASVHVAAASQSSFAARGVTTEAIFLAIMFSSLLCYGQSPLCRALNLRVRSLVDRSRFSSS